MATRFVTGLGDPLKLTKRMVVSQATVDAFKIGYEAGFCDARRDPDDIKYENDESLDAYIAYLCDQWLQRAKMPAKFRDGGKYNGEREESAGTRSADKREN
jgi:hypothetical protein